MPQNQCIKAACWSVHSMRLKQIRAIVEAWAQGDLDRLEPHVDDKERAAFQRLMWNRNSGIAARIEELHQSGSRVFAAVGILHMVSEQVLPKLLVERGFTAERVVSAAAACAVFLPCLPAPSPLPQSQSDSPPRPPLRLASMWEAFRQRTGSEWPGR